MSKWVQEYIDDQSKTWQKKKKKKKKNKRLTSKSKRASCCILKKFSADKMYVVVVTDELPLFGLIEKIKSFFQDERAKILKGEAKWVLGKFCWDFSIDQSLFEISNQIGRCYLNHIHYLHVKLFRAYMSLAIFQLASIMKK